MTVSTSRQATQARVLVGLQRRAALGFGAATAAYLGQLFGLTRQQTAAALSLLEDKGLVARAARAGRFGDKLPGGRWYLTTEGLNAEVK